MKEFHFSTAECYDSCPHKFKLTYLDELETLPTDDPQNPLILGTAIHRAMEEDLETAVNEYLNSYPVIDDRHINEIIKMYHWIPQMKKLIPEGFMKSHFPMITIWGQQIFWFLLVVENMIFMISSIPTT